VENKIHLKGEDMKPVGKFNIYGFRILKYFPQLQPGQTYILQDGMGGKKYIKSTNNEIKVSLDDCLKFPDFFKPLYSTNETTKFVIVNTDSNKIFSGNEKENMGWVSTLNGALFFDNYEDAEKALAYDTGDVHINALYARLFNMVRFADFRIIQI
jgi:hypothetical protein